jgi:hypothetical protein
MNNICNNYIAAERSVLATLLLIGHLLGMSSWGECGPITEGRLQPRAEMVWNGTGLSLWGSGCHHGKLPDAKFRVLVRALQLLCISKNLEKIDCKNIWLAGQITMLQLPNYNLCTKLHASIYYHTSF